MVKKPETMALFIGGFHDGKAMLIDKEPPDHIILSRNNDNSDIAFNTLYDPLSPSFDQLMYQKIEFMAPGITKIAFYVYSSRSQMRR